MTPENLKSKQSLELQWILANTAITSILNGKFKILDMLVSMCMHR